MKKVKILNPMSFVYLFFAAVICVFAAVVERTSLLSLCIISGLSAIALFILEGFYYPKMSKKVNRKTGKPININTYVSPLLTFLLSFYFLPVLLWFALERGLLWLFVPLAWIIITLSSYRIVRRNLEKWQKNEYLKLEAKYPYVCGINLQGAKNRIELISNKEQRVARHRWYLAASFFPITIAVIWIYISALMEPVTNQLLVMEHDRAIGARIIITLMLYMTAIIIGYLYDRAIVKELGRLWEIKKSFIRMLNVAKE